MQVLVATLAATVVLLLAGCRTAVEDKTQTPVQVKADKDGVQRVRVVAGSYFFKPSHIVVKVNTPVELVASREGGMIPHDLVIDGHDVKQDLATEPRKIAFTPKKAGKYAIYCSKKPPLGGASHRERGMEGVLEVVP
jgi:plastocyanin